jgi:putative tryptophan/tyrosine transport system substrate-binding protein
MPVIGYLSAQSADDDYKDFTVPFLQGLKETGYVDGQNVAIEYHWAENQMDRLPALAADLLRRRVAVIFDGGSTPAALDWQQQQLFDPSSWHLCRPHP